MVILLPAASPTPILVDPRASHEYTCVIVEVPSTFNTAVTNILLVELRGVIVADSPVTTAPPDAWVVVVEKVSVLVTLTTWTTEFITAPSVPCHLLNFIVPMLYHRPFRSVRHCDHYIVS